MRPALEILSPHPARFAALRSLWPTAPNTAPNAAGDIHLVDATDGLPASLPRGPLLVLTQARPTLPPQARWLASPARAETIAAGLDQCWRARWRNLGPAILRLDPPGLHHAEEILPLSEKEAHLLAALTDRPGGLTRAEVLAAGWGAREDLDSHALETQLYRLRQKIKPLLGEGLELGMQKGLCRLVLS